MPYRSLAYRESHMTIRSILSVTERTKLFALPDTKDGFEDYGNCRIYLD
jgi:hypothetical protein